MPGKGIFKNLPQIIYKDDSCKPQNSLAAPIMVARYFTPSRSRTVEMDHVKCMMLDTEKHKMKRQKSPRMPLLHEDVKIIGIGTSMPFYPTKDLTMTPPPKPTYNKKLKQICLDTCSESKKGTVTGGIIPSAFKSQAEKKWNWKGVNGKFDVNSLHNWHKHIIEQK